MEKRKRLLFPGIESMYTKLPNLTIGFHGCSKDTYQDVIIGHHKLKPSDNTYDWLGNGIYFWENNLARAWEWAEKKHGKNASVIGAVIDLGRCLNLTDSASIELLKNGYEALVGWCELSGKPLPQNRPSNKSKDILLRDLDCAVIQQVHDMYKPNKDSKTAFDSVRGIFIEGEPPYEGSAMASKTHVQICICNPNCIKGYFEPREADDEYPIP